MEEITARTGHLLVEVEASAGQLKIADLSREAAQLEAASRQHDFWDNPIEAEQASKRLAKLQARIQPWQQLIAGVQEAHEMAGLGDNSLNGELNKQVSDLESQFASLKQHLKFSGPYDDHDAILHIHSGAGGTDAQDWTQMLLRMYSRYGERGSLGMKLIEETAGEEAGLKSAVLELTGDFAYGRLKSEHGVHRLVRLSPYNSDNLRQTSFARVEVMPKIDRPGEIEIDESDLKIDVYRAGGRGGQSVNTTDSAVRITHMPTGISVAIQNERSQQQNKATAMTVLRSRLAGLQLEQHQAKVSSLKGPNQSAEWGNQIRSYVLHPYKMVKDLRTGHESSNVDAVLDGELDGFIEAYLEQNLSAGK